MSLCLAGSALEVPSTGREDVEDSVDNGETNRLKTLKRQLQQELDEKEDLLADYKQQLNERDELLTKLGAENRNLSKNFLRNQELQDELDSLREKALLADRLQEDLGRSKQRLTELEFFQNRVKELDDEVRILGSFQLERDHLITRINSLNLQRTEAELQLLEARQTIGQLQKELGVLCDANRDLEAKVSELQQHIETAHRNSKVLSLDDSHSRHILEESFPPASASSDRRRSSVFSETAFEVGCKYYQIDNMMPSYRSVSFTSAKEFENLKPELLVTKTIAMVPQGSSLDEQCCTSADCNHSLESVTTTENSTHCHICQQHCNHVCSRPVVETDLHLHSPACLKTSSVTSHNIPAACYLTHSCSSGCSSGGHHSDVVPDPFHRGYNAKVQRTFSDNINQKSELDQILGALWKLLSDRTNPVDDTTKTTMSETDSNSNIQPETVFRNNKAVERETQVATADSSLSSSSTMPKAQYILPEWTERVQEFQQEPGEKRSSLAHRLLALKEFLLDLFSSNNASERQQRSLQLELRNRVI